jgi:hypothetical protein
VVRARPPGTGREQHPESLLILSLLSVASGLTNFLFAANYSFDKPVHLWKVNETMNTYNFEVIGDKSEDPFKSDRKEDGFAVKNVELLIGYWTCRGPLSGRNLVEHLAEKFKDHPEKWSQDDGVAGQYRVFRTDFFLEPADIQDVIAFLKSEEQYFEDFTATVIPIFESAINWLQRSEHPRKGFLLPRKGVRLVTKFYA